MWCSTRQKKRSFSPPAIRFGNITLSPKTSVKCLGFHIDSDVSFTLHVSKTVSSCFAVLRQIRSVRRSLTMPLLITLVTALVLPRIDYCISVLSGIQLFQTRRLQHVLHASARLIFGASRFASISSS